MLRRAAAELLAEQGADALTARGLGRRLGIAPSAIYSHVATMSELVDEVLDDLLGLIDAPDPKSSEWERGLIEMMLRTHELLLEHPGLVPLYMARRGARGPNAQRLGAIMLDLLAAHRVTGPNAREAVRALLVYTIGSAAFTAQPPIGADGESAGISSAELKGNFERGLRWLLDGIGFTAPPLPRQRA